MARSGSVWTRALIAMSFSSSSLSASGLTFGPPPPRISSSSARTSLPQELPGYFEPNARTSASASAFRPCLLSAYASQ